MGIFDKLLEKGWFVKSKTRMTNSIGMKLTLIPAGEFIMGSNGHGYAANPPHKVKISKSFFIGTYPVTQKQWCKIMGGYLNNPSQFKGDNLPVESMSWNEVQEFIRRLNEKEGTNKYRLPSEAEWEYGARAGTTTAYSFGDDKTKLGEYAWYLVNSDGKTHKVGQKKPNQWGLYDMHGNVSEWVRDSWHDTYDGAPTDGSVWEEGGTFELIKSHDELTIVGGDFLRVIRGGSWFMSDVDCRSATRLYVKSPVGLSPEVGFRLVMEI